jgi:L-threonylcarbamoyladenylate synthase
VNGAISLSLQKQVDKGITTLKSGGLVAYPTDTVYGLGASMTAISAIAKIFEVKNRARDMALPLLAADHEQIRQIGRTVPPAAWLLIYNFMPGALTIILPKADVVPSAITAGGETVAVRIPDHPVPLALIRGLGKPIVGTSANLSGRPSPLTAEEVRQQIGGSVDLIIDGGKTPGGVESTIVDMTGKKPVIRRLGAISLEVLKRTCPDIELAMGGGS